eukprot:CAMPEP_0179341690 /NCGR_PEP_ID=MMETSP0797-20121207/69986_1 /TAXON_ID=47934 /ORGANISM="Dinophysis acuminata, Strain DAEP01" /LENGTH=36 /DNA_ID= /DNA_START= /DNA_END= /DNA_ORIENTATION=
MALESPRSGREWQGKDDLGVAEHGAREDVQLKVSRS